MNMLCIQIKNKKNSIQKQNQHTVSYTFNITLQYCTLVFGNSYITVGQDHVQSATNLCYSFNISIRLLYQEKT